MLSSKYKGVKGADARHIATATVITSLCDWLTKSIFVSFLCVLAAFLGLEMCFLDIKTREICSFWAFFYVYNRCDNCYTVRDRCCRHIWYLWVVVVCLFLGWRGCWSDLWRYIELWGGCLLAVAGSEVGVDRVQTVQQQGSSKLHAGPHSPSVISSGRHREQRQQEKHLCWLCVCFLSLCTSKWGSGGAFSFSSW